MKADETKPIKWEYEDRITFPITAGMFRASKVDGVRLYPYILLIAGKRIYLELEEGPTWL